MNLLIAFGLGVLVGLCIDVAPPTPPKVIFRVQGQ